MLELNGLKRRFGGVKALDGVSLKVEHGTIVGLIGPNGSGKSTLVNVVSGYIRPDAGTVAIDGQDVTGVGAARLRRIGLARTFQNIRLFDDLTARENLQAGLHSLFVRTGSSLAWFR